MRAYRDDAESTDAFHALEALADFDLAEELAEDSWLDLQDDLEVEVSDPASLTQRVARARALLEPGTLQTLGASLGDEPRRRLDCLLALLVKPGVDDRYINGEAYEVKAGVRERSPSEFNRLFRHAKSELLGEWFGSDRSDEEIVRQLQLLDRRIASGVAFIRLHVGTSEGFPDPAKRQIFLWISERQRDPNSVYTCYGGSEGTAKRGWLDWLFGDKEFELFYAGLDTEISRTSSAYIRWVQAALNELLGTTLAVDGISGRRTRDTIRTFQRQHGLSVDGIVGPMTEQSMVAAGASAPPTDAGRVPTGGPALGKLEARDVKYLAIEGGGGKGNVLPGALKALESPTLNILQRDGLKPTNIRGFAGSSAGAITALFLSCGYDYEEISFITTRTNFDEFFDPLKVGRVPRLGGCRDVGIDTDEVPV